MWQRIAYPFPPDGQAHCFSTTPYPSFLVNRGITWPELPKGPEEEIEVPALPDEDLQEIVNNMHLALPFMDSRGECTALVLLAYGTVLFPAGDLPFAGFAESTSNFVFPQHRVGNIRRRTRGLLSAAQRRWHNFQNNESSETVVQAARALALLNLAGYPQPGTDRGDANVVGLWRHKVTHKILALVGCDCALDLPGAMLTFVLNEPVDRIDAKQMGALASTGRAHLRLEFLFPSVVKVLSVEQKSVSLGYCVCCFQPCYSPKRCAKCKTSTYCSRHCQKVDWPKHRLCCAK